jgi:hypothetical protein
MQEATRPAASQGTLACLPKGMRIPISVLEVRPNHGRAAYMFKFFKRAWNLVRDALGAFRLYEILRDLWNDPQ